LTVADAALVLIVGAILSREHGTAGWMAALVAACLCWVGSIIALVLAAVSPTTAAVHGMLLGIFARTGLPLAGGLALSLQSSMLAEAGLMPALLACYLVTLLIETGLSLGLVAGPKQPPLSPRASGQAAARS